MNKQEIDDMMKDLPSQQIPEETLAQKVLIGIIFLIITNVFNINFIFF